MQVPVNRWNQFGGNEAGSGFRAINTVAPFRPAAQYIQLPSDIGSSSPVTGPNGTVVAGTNDGHVFVCRPRSGPPPYFDFLSATRVADYIFAVQTPAVAEDGTIYPSAVRQ